VKSYFELRVDEKTSIYVRYVGCFVTPYCLKQFLLSVLQSWRFRLLSSSFDYSTWKWNSNTETFNVGANAIVSSDNCFTQDEKIINSTFNVYYPSSIRHSYKFLGTNHSCSIISFSNNNLPGPIPIAMNRFAMLIFFCSASKRAKFEEYNEHALWRGWSITTCTTRWLTS
jgi:hypothetical protein